MKFIITILLFFTLSAKGQQVLFHANNYTTASSCDADAEAFFLAAGITDATQKAAVCQLVTDLKAAGIWTKMYAIYPFVGGTENSCKWNLKNPLDTDAAFRIVWVAPSAITFSSTGFKPNLTGYADTRFKQSVNAGPSSFSISFYSRTNQAAADQYDMGAFGSGGNQLLGIKLASGNAYGAIDGGTAAQAVPTNTLGLFMVSRISTTSISLYRNGVSLNTQTASTASNPNAINTYIGYVNGLFNSTKECAFATISQGLNSTEATALYTAIQAFQTTLGRQV